MPEEKISASSIRSTTCWQHRNKDMSSEEGPKRGQKKLPDGITLIPQSAMGRREEPTKHSETKNRTPPKGEVGIVRWASPFQTRIEEVRRRGGEGGSPQFPVERPAAKLWKKKPLLHMQGDPLPCRSFLKQIDL